MKTKFMKSKRIMAVILSVVMMFVMLSAIPVSATQSRKDNFSTNYTLTGIGATDILNVAMAQVGKTGSQLGYTEQWCADFVCDCADLARQSAAIPRTGGVTEIKSNTINAGGYIVSSPQPGDLVIWKNSKISHVEIVSKVVNGVVYSIGGNNGSTGNPETNYVAGERKVTSIGTVSCYVRPNYSGNLVKPTVSTNSKYYVPGASVEISWTTSSGATGYWIDIWKDGTGFISNNLGNVNSYTNNFGSGFYEVYVTAYSENGGWSAVISDVYEFHVQDVSAPTVSTNSKYYAPGASVEISWTTSSGATGYWIDIWKDGTGFISNNLGNVNSYTNNFGSGFYEVYVTAYSENGGWSAVISDVYGFHVQDVSAPTVSTNSKYYASGENVEILWDEPVGATAYWLDIWKDGEHIYTGDLGKSNVYTSKFDCGEYGIFITARNDLNGGWSAATSEVCRFYVTEYAMTGDINIDGTVNVDDIIILKSYLLNKETLTSDQMARADLNSDGNLNSLDIVILKNKFTKQ